MSVYSLILMCFIFTGINSCKKAVNQQDTIALLPPPPPVLKGPGNDLNLWNLPEFIVDEDGIAAVHFNKSQKQGLYVTSNPTLQGGATDLTLAGWVKFDTVSGMPQVIACKDNDSTSEGSEYYLGYYPAYKSFVFQVETLTATTKYVVSSIGKPLPGIWYYVLGSYDHVNGKVFVEVNNSTKDSVSGVDNMSHTTKTAFTIGCDANSAADSLGRPHGGFLSGSISSVTLWKRLLSPSEKLTLYNYDGTHSGPNVATLNVDAWSTNLPSAILSNQYSVSLDGQQTYVKTTSRISLGTKSSVSLWFNPSAFGGCLLGNGRSGNPYVILADDESIKVQTDTMATVKTFKISAITTGTWHNLVIVRDSVNTHVYVDGVESSSGGQPQAYAITLDQIGKLYNGPASAFNGNIADLKIWFSTLPEEQVEILAEGKETAFTPLYYYKMNEGSGNVVHNYARGIPLLYEQLPDVLRNEDAETFVSWWNLNEQTGIRKDSRWQAQTP